MVQVEGIYEKGVNVLDAGWVCKWVVLGVGLVLLGCGNAAEWVCRS